MSSTGLLEKSIAGEITLADDSGTALKKWREIFNVSQAELAKVLKISPSVISDYESGRRTPGIGFVKRIVNMLISMDDERGGEIIKKFLIDSKSDAILDLKEFLNPISGGNIVKAVKGKIVANKEFAERNLYGYTVVDSIKAILTMSENELKKMYGSTTQRALVFTNVSTGRSPMIAIRVTQPKPSMIVFHGLRPERVDKLAVSIAKVEGIPLVISTLRTEDELIKNLNTKLAG